MFEIRIHSRGGQGGVTAARLLALAAIHDGKYATAAPFYGAERRGAPIVSFVRIDDKPIKVYSQIKRPDMVIVLDASVIDVVDVLQDARTSEITMRQVSAIQINPLFISSSLCLNMENFRMIDYDLIFRVHF